MRPWLPMLLLWAAPAIVAPAWAGSVLDRVRTDGVVRCGAEERPGFAAGDGAGGGRGLAVELCRAAAMAVLGRQARVEFQVFDSDTDFAAVRSGAEDIAFLSGPAIAQHHLAGMIIPGAAVLFDQVTLMVPQDSAAHDLADLAGQVVCFLIGSPAQRALEQDAARLHLEFARLAFEEEVEMLDAYNVQRCQAMAGEATALAASRRTPGADGLRSRVLLRPLALTPVLAATPVGDGRWAALVAWVLQGVILADRAETPWAATGADAMPFAAADLGLRPDWLQDAGSHGFYREMFDHMLGAGSPLQLQRGPNAAWPEGMLLPATN